MGYKLLFGEFIVVNYAGTKEGTKDIIIYILHN